MNSAIPELEHARKSAVPTPQTPLSCPDRDPCHEPARAVSRVGFIGTGFIADWHAKALAELGQASIVAACDTNASRLKSFSDEFGIARRYSNWNEMLKDEPLDAVHILLPPLGHHAAARDALEHGLDVLVEKPLGVNVCEVEDLVQLAESQGRYLAVSHNFAFDPCYQQLREDLRSGTLGRVDQLTITWNRELPQILNDSPSQWMFAQPENLMLEIGPHSVSQMQDLMGGPPDDMQVRAENPRTLSNRRTIYRRWLVDADYDQTLVRLVFSFVPGFTEHTVHVRGSLASATADLEGWTYDLQRHSPYQDDFDRYHITRQRAIALRRQAGGNLRRYLAGKFKLSQRGNQYGYSIQQTCAAFYRGIQGNRDSRIDGRTGLDVMRTCVEIGGRANLQTSVPRVIPATPDVPCMPVNTLVLGGTGFIGRELVRQLAASGVGVRVLSRDSHRFEGNPHWNGVDCHDGSLSDPDALQESLQGIDTVYHLARSYGNTWKDFAENDLIWTQQIAEACLQQGVGRLIYTGTIDSYYAGRPGDVISEQTPLDPRIHLRKPYARAKAQDESLLLRMHCEQGLPLVIARPGIVIGRGGSPFHWGVGMFTNQAVAHLWGNGRNPLPFVLVQDVAAALMRMRAVDGIEGESFNLIGEPLLNAREYVEELERLGRHQAAGSTHADSEVLRERHGQVRREAAGPASRPVPSLTARLAGQNPTGPIRLQQGPSSAELEPRERPRHAAGGGDPPACRRVSPLSPDTNPASLASMTQEHPDTELTAAVIGLGHIAKQHIAALQKVRGVRLGGVCDRSAATAEATAERFGIPRWYTNHQQMLDELRPDCVHITTPPASHSTLAQDALHCGAHAFVEKPLAPRYDDVRTLLDCADQQKRVLIEDYNYVFDPQVQRVLRLIETGQFGDVTHVDLMLCLDLTQAAGGVADEGASACLAGGPVGDFFPHLASLAYFFVGAASEVRTIWSGPLEFRSVAKARRGTAGIHFSSASQPDGFWLRVYGGRMQATINLFEPHCTLRRVRSGPRPLTPLWNGLDVARDTRRSAWRGLSRKLSGGPGSYAGLHELIDRCYRAMAEHATPPILPEDIEHVNRFIQKLSREESGS